MFSRARITMMQQLRVAVVGAGAAGLCAARHILARPDTFAPPVVYELTEHVGGTWFYEERTGSYDNGLPIHSSMYRNLRTNLPKEVMMFPDFPFDSQLPSFLPHEEVQRYLERYCQCHLITPHIRFSTVVEEVRPITEETEKGVMTTWEVTSQDKSGSQETQTFDSVFICSGHYSDPYIPSIPGIERFKGKVIHSHSYRHPEPFSGQSVVVLGAGASGLDISLELGRSNAQVTLSHGKPTLPFPLPYGIHQATPVVEVQEDGSLRFQDGAITQAQVLMLCTGYKFSYPFLKPAQLGLEIHDHLVTPLYKFLMPPAFPSLFIIGICKMICPFQQFHCQTQFSLAVLEGSVTLPSQAEMEEEAVKEMERKVEWGVKPRNMLKMDKDQWSYARTLAQMGKFPPLTPVTQSLYEEVWRQKQAHPQIYRHVNYRLVSDTQWEQQDRQAGE
uniref:Flavin-containing monooxygenase n=2 Tax=Esox lucius TaxID=8010 RepID=A0A6Q2X033_ESOLU